MGRTQLVNFWPLVPAVDIQAVYETLKCNDKKDSADVDFKSTDSENETDSDIEILEQSEGSKDDEVQIIKSYDIPTIAVSDIPFKDYKNESSNFVCAAKKDVNILIMGDGAGCLMKTISRMYRHEADNLNIYIVSRHAESLVRKLLFLSLLHESSLVMDDLGKAKTFLEIFGNTFLEISTSSFIETKSTSILDDIGTSKQLLPTIPSVSLNFLKHQEIDEICKILFFLKSSESTYEIKTAWENSLRAYFGTKYDNRKNLFNYQYNMFLYHYPVIKLLKYREWCETGTAFKLCDADYTFPNKTLRLHNIGSSVKSSDFYFGDITNSPYITFGVECGDKTFFKKSNDQYLHTSEDISKFNVMDLFTEFTQKASKEKIITVHPLFYPTFFKKDELENFFDAAYVTRDMTSYTMYDSTKDEECFLAKVLKKDGIAMFETMKNVVNSSKEQKSMFSMHINNLARRNDLKLVGTFGDGCFKIFEANVSSSDSVKI